jgi:hypothetical protein
MKEGHTMIRHTSKVVRSPIGPRDIWAVFCPPLNLRFPTVYRIVQSMTREQLDDRGVHDEEPFVYNHYTLDEEDDDARRYPGTIERRTIRSLDPAIDRVSLVIRYQRIPDEALGYWQGLYDYGVGCGTDAIFPTEEGTFTLITRPTKPSWPGHLIIYCVDKVPTDDLIGEDSWVLAVAPDGSLIERFDDF